MLKSIQIVLASEYCNVGNEYVQVDGLAIPIDMVISLTIEPLEEA